MPHAYCSASNPRPRAIRLWLAACTMAGSLLAVAGCAAPAAPVAASAGTAYPSLVAAKAAVPADKAPAAEAVATEAPAAEAVATATPTAATPAAAAGRRKNRAATTGDTNPDCTKATKAKIVERTSGAGTTYSFSRRAVTIQRGGFLAITNTSDRAHALVSTPDAGIVTSILDRQERQVIQFPKAGRFTVQSAAAAHRAVLRVTVSGESGCDTISPTLNIVDGYAFSPAKLVVAATANFAVENKSGTAQTVRCAPDPGGNGDNSRLDRGETQLLAIDQPGRYRCASVQHPDAKVTIKVE
jgi:hypothetical protein